MRPSPGEGPQAGFTLLEMLTALLLFGFLSAGLTQGLQTGIAAFQAQRRQVAARQDFLAADNTLRALFARMSPGGLDGQDPIFAGSRSSVVFTTTLPQATSALAIPAADVTLAVDAGRHVQLSWVSHFPDRSQSAPVPERVVLLSHVERLEISYWDPATDWRSEWAAAQLPRLIRIHLVPTRDSSWAVPDILVRPMRDRWRQ